MQDSQHDLGSRLSTGMPVDGNTTTVVDDRDGIVYVDLHADLVAITSQRFVDRVIDHFIDEVMQPCRSG